MSNFVTFAMLLTFGIHTMPCSRIHNYMTFLYDHNGMRMSGLFIYLLMKKLISSDNEVYINEYQQT